MSTALAVIDQSQGTGLSVFDRIDPMKFVEDFGKIFYLTTAGGAQTLEQGKLMALACLCERKSVFDIAREYHLMDGKLSMKAETMLARLRQLGGKHKWIKTGDDGIDAELELTYDGNTIISRFSIEDAKKAGLVKDKGNWVKNPGPMLRARCTSNGVRMIAPEVSGGYYTPEENEDVAADNGRASAVTVAPETAAAVKRRGKELREANGQATQQPATPVAEPQQTQAADEVIEAEVASSDAAETAQVATEAPTTTFDPAAPGSATTATLMEVENLLTRAGSNVETMVTQLQKKSPDLVSLDSLSEERALVLLKNLEAKVNAAKK